MAVTASKIGSSPLTADWTHLPRRYEPDATILKENWEKTKLLLGPQGAGFFDAPLDDEISQNNSTQQLAQEFVDSDLTDFVFLGIGGSHLGPDCLLDALGAKNSEKQFHFLNSPDPDVLYSTLGRLKKDQTLFCVIAKSGKTFETLAQLSVVYEWLGYSRVREQIVVVTDPVKGELREWVNLENIRSLPIHPSLGGRYSVFSPVGLFPLALSGGNCDEFLKGALEVRQSLEKMPVEKNPIFLIASELFRYYPQRSIHVCIPYAERLAKFGDWYSQLWSESLGKNGKGFTPVSSVGPAAQHSILQLLRDGPDDKVTFFLKVNQREHDFQLSAPPFVLKKPGAFPVFRSLQGHSLGDLIAIEHRAISQVLTRQERPHFTVGLDQLNERSMGALFFSFCVLTAYTGVLLDVNPFDQPGVEEGKVYIQQSLMSPKEA